MNVRLICLVSCLLYRDKAFELSVPPTWISDIKARILRNYKGPVKLQDPSHSKSKPVITYLSRQTATFRRLKQTTHEELVAGLKSLEHEGIADVFIEEFTDSNPKEDQVAKLSRTTVSITRSAPSGVYLLFPVVTVDLRWITRKRIDEFNLYDT